MVIPAATISQAHIQNRGAFRVAQRIYPATACLFIGKYVLENRSSKLRQELTRV